MASLVTGFLYLTLEGPCIIFCNIYTFRDTQCSSTDCLLMHRCQLYMFRTIMVHPQELLFRCCMCRLGYVVRNALSGTSRWYNVWGRTPQTLHQWDVSPHTIVCTYSIYKEAPEDGPLRSETCRADTCALINNQCYYIVYLVWMYIYWFFVVIVFEIVT